MAGGDVEQVVTSGVVSTKSMKLRPLTGRLATACGPTVAAWAVRVASSTGASAVTVMASAAATLRVRSTLRVWPTVRGRPGWRAVAKPCNAAVTS